MAARGADPRTGPTAAAGRAVAAAALVLLAACSARPASGPSAGAPASASIAAEATPAPDLFARDVQPTLARRCSPCHVPGGRMYERMPFDQPVVVAEHQDGILQRLKDPAERQAVEAWLASRPR
jgi:hypothetical protein